MTAPDQLRWQLVWGYHVGMTYAAKLVSNLSPAARTALTNVGTSRQGATLPAGTLLSVVTELVESGLVGVGLGLTRAGSIAREHIQEADLVDAFGI